MVVATKQIVAWITANVIMKMDSHAWVGGWETEFIGGGLGKRVIGFQVQLQWVINHDVN